MNADGTRLSDYIDGELSREETAALEARLAEDSELRQLVEELRVVKQTAAARPAFEAPADLWRGVERRLGGDTGIRRRLMLTLPQLAAAAGIILLLGVSLGRMSDPGATAVEQIAVGPDGPTSELTTAASPGRNYAAFVADLERRIDEGRDVLAPETARVIEESLAKIDSAITRAQHALENDPNNAYLNQHLASARSRKLRLLEDATTLIASRT